MKVTRVRTPRLQRAGFHVMVLAVLVGLLMGAAGMVLAQRSRTAPAWAARAVAELAVRDLVHSAVEEATHEAMRAVNDRAAALWTRLRDADWDRVELTPRLERARAMLARTPHVTALDASIVFEERSPLVPGAEEDSEWSARLTVRAEAWLAEPGRGRVCAVQEREVRATSISPPRPLDALGLLVASQPASSWFPSMETGGPGFDQSLDAKVWRHKATLRIGGSDPGQDYERLARRLGTVNGVVLVDNAGGRPLVIAGRRHRGKTVLVTLGPLELEDVGPEEPGVDHLTVIAFGDTRLAGRVQAALVLTSRQGEPVPERSLAPGTELDGALIVTSGPRPKAAGARLTVDTGASFAGGMEGRLHPDRVVVSISPVLTRSVVEVRS